MTHHHRTTEISIRQNATTEPGVSDHLTSVELPENTSTAVIIAMSPAGRNSGRRKARRPVTTVLAVIRKLGRRRAR